MDHHRTDTACRVCGAPVAPAYALCFCCAVVVRQLKMPLAPVVAVAEFHPGDPLHRRLRGYKDAPVAEGRAVCAARLAAMLAAWLTTGAGRRWTTTVAEWDVRSRFPPRVDRRATRWPTSFGRSRPWPDGIGRCSSEGPPRWVTSEPTARVSRCVPAPGWLRGRTVLVIDDCVVTGARAQRAAAALRLGGAEVVGVVALGRLAPMRPSCRR